MPVSPAMAEELAQEVLGYYAEAERLLLERIAKRLAKGLEAPDWAEKKLAQLAEYRREVEALLHDLHVKADQGIESAVTQAYERGGLAAVEDLARAGREAVEWLPGLRAIEAMTKETLGYVSATHPRILRSTMDAYRSVVAEASEQVLLGTQTRREATQAALDRFAKKGITGFVDKGGHSWSLESYVEMAMRTGTGRAAVQGHLDRLQENGVDLVIVSDAPRECPLCREWEGKVLRIGGADLTQEPTQTREADGQAVMTDYPTVDEARAAGLFHVNCRHSLGAYFEGITRPMKNTADPEGYAATSRLRYYERQVRASKRMQAVALDEDALRRAKQRQAVYQAKIRELTSTTSAKRQPVRERLGAR